MCYFHKLPFYETEIMETNTDVQVSWILFVVLRNSCVELKQII